MGGGKQGSVITFEHASKVRHCVNLQCSEASHALMSCQKIAGRFLDILAKPSSVVPCGSVAFKNLHKQLQ